MTRKPFTLPDRGFTLVELVVVISILALLAAMLLPAIQYAREAARCLQCRNNLRQIGVAVSGYHDAANRFPPGEFLGTSGAGQHSRAWSWMARVLPFMEQGNLYEQGRVGQVAIDDSGIASRKIALFLCPSDSHSHIGPRSDAGNLAGFAVGQTNYKAVCGANWGHDASQNLTQIGTDWANPGTNGSSDGLGAGDGAMYRSDINTQRNYSLVTDGLTNTFMVGEALPKFDAWCSWPYSNNAYSTCAIPLNVRPRAGSNYHPLWWPNVQSFRSRHPRGGVFLSCDDSVRFISDSIDLRVYRASATIAGNEP